MRLQTFYLPSGDPASGIRFALIVDQVRENPAPAEVEALRRFGREIGAESVLISGVPVDIEVDLDVAEEPGPAPGPASMEIDRPSLGTAIARAVRTHLETQGGTLRGPRGG